MNKSIKYTQLQVIVALHQQHGRFAGAHDPMVKMQHYSSRLPSMALAKVTSSVYSRSLPTGTP